MKISQPCFLGMAIFVVLCRPLDAATWTEVQPLLAKYCLECHTGQEAKGDLDLQPLMQEEAAWLQDAELLEGVEFLVAENEMPPPTAKKFPTATERKALLNWALEALHRIAVEVPDDPGVVVMPRLTRDTYNRTVSDLAGVDIAPGDVLPIEAPSGEGFTNVGENQTMEPNQFEKYLRAADATMTHARITPVSMTWDATPLVKVEAPWRQREAKFTDFLDWFSGNLSKLSNDPEEWYKEDGVGHATYWWYAWAWKHRDVLGLKAEKPVEVVPPDEEREVNPVILANWVRFFEAETDNDVLTELKRRWAKAPAPGQITAEEARQQFGELESWFRLFTDYLNDEPDIELKTSRIYTRPVENEWEKAGKYVFRHDFRQYNGDKPMRKLHLIATTALTPHTDDVVVWRQGRFLYGEELNKKDPGPSKPWHELPGMKLTDQKGRPVAWGSHPDGEKIPQDAVAVRAPQILILPVPEDATGLELEVFLDKEKYPQVHVQTWVSPDLPEGPDGSIEDWITGRRPIGADDPNQKFRRANHQWRDVIYEWNKYAISANCDYVWTRTDGLHAYYTEITRPYEPEKAHNEPYRLNPDEYFEAIDEEELAKHDLLLKELEALAQKPHQDLVALGKKHGVQLQEGQLPTPDQLAGFPGEAAGRARDLAHAIVQEEQRLRQMAGGQVAEFTTRAWRRAPDNEELEDLLSLYTAGREKGMSYDAAVKEALRGALVSPHFLYRYQKSRQTDEPYPINARGLADRLAMVLWGSIPDAQLLERVADGSLVRDDVLPAETRRMLQDDRAARLAELFAAEWIGYKDFSSHNDPDPDRYERYHEEEIAPLMEREATLFFNDLLRGNAPATALYQAEFSYLNETLAKFYGIEGVNGKEFRRVELPERRRGGALTLGATLTKKSMPLRTSAVLRGAWIIEKIIGEHLPDPPPDVPELSADETNESGLTVAQQLAKHRADPACMGCHQRIDPMGIALENFDPVGQWRSEFLDGTPVTSEDVAADGTPIQGLSGLTSFLDERKDKVIYNFCRMFAGYALGRSIQPSDRPLIEAMRDAVLANDNQFPQAVEVLVLSKQFRYRRDEV